MYEFLAFVEEVNRRMRDRLMGRSDAIVFELSSATAVWQNTRFHAALEQTRPSNVLLSLSAFDPVPAQVGEYRLDDFGLRDVVQAVTAHFSRDEES